MNALSVLVQLGLLAVAILLKAIMMVCLLSFREALKLLDVVGLLHLCREKEQFLIDCCCVFLYLICVKHLYQPCAYMNSSRWLVCSSFYRCLLSTEKGCGDYQ